MNLCFLSWSEIDINGHGLLSVEKQRFECAGVKQMTHLYFTSGSAPEALSDVDRIAIFSRRPGRKNRLCLSLLRSMNQRGAIHPFAAGIPLGWCKDEILEALLACDPDIVVMTNLRWSASLRKMILRAYPQWKCMERWSGEPTVGNSSWRSFDPHSVKVSIVLPTYNGSKFLAQSIESCLNQTVKNLELLIVDDGSTEDIYSIIRRYENPRLRYLRHENNKGVAEALNTGFGNSTGEYLTWTSDDNYYAPTALEEMLRFLQTYTNIDFVYADSFVLEERSEKSDLAVWRARSPRVLDSFNGITPCFLYKRKVYERIGNYNSDCFLAEDYDYWVRVSRRFRMQRLFKPLYYYRRHAASLTETYGSQAVARQARAVRARNAV